MAVTGEVTAVDRSIIQHNCTFGYQTNGCYRQVAVAEGLIVQYNCTLGYHTNGLLQGCGCFR